MSYTPIMSCNQVAVMTCQTCHNYMAAGDYCAWSHIPNLTGGTPE